MKSLYSHAKRFNALKVGTKAWNKERKLLESLNKKGVLKPVKTKKNCFLDQFGYAQVFTTYYFVMGKYSFKLIDHYTF